MVAVVLTPDCALHEAVCKSGARPVRRYPLGRPPVRRRLQGNVRWPVRQRGVDSIGVRGQSAAPGDTAVVSTTGPMPPAAKIPSRATAVGTWLVLLVGKIAACLVILSLLDECLTRHRAQVAQNRTRRCRGRTTAEECGLRGSPPFELPRLS
ncbi:hypothetical protein EJ04DRAFT_555146 [Polyplosphaeria fusca]|uniref:Uncharacterized protein n=1 Tax=Polyplosphaeria fusca TaxID=682080 RepID=A0A9P4QNN3_9PLEO|nr:hypothetical protein EJ04DRAFT_555146 [Polyplosphaeria fusca]